MQFRVTMDACVAGNPHKAWKVRLPDGVESGDELAPDREPPDDVWEQQTHEFDDLEAAKDFVRSLPEQTTTHVVLEFLDTGAEIDKPAPWVAIFVQDAGADHLDDAAPGVPMPHEIDSALPFEDETIEEAPPVLPSQGAAQ